MGLASCNVPALNLALGVSLLRLEFFKSPPMLYALE